MLILVPTATGNVSISSLTSLVGFPVDVTSSAITVKTSVITSGIKNYNSIIKEVLTSKALIY